LEKRSYLVATIIKYIFFLKIPIFLFFIYVIDDLSNIIIGAMCAAGVVDASSYGIPLLILKVVNLYLFGFWLIIHYGDLRFQNLPFSKIKFGFFIVAALLILIEIGLDFLMFDSIDLSKIAICCGALFSNSSTTYLSLLFAMDTQWYGYLFYLIYLILIFFFFIRNDYLYSLINIIYLLIAITSLIVFFGTYIYELPTHHCPFCILQYHYFYIGYFLYGFLFFGTFFGMGLMAVDLVGGNKEFYYKISIIFNSIYMLILSYYLFGYYIKNGVWL
jgi:hypothetical protein